MDIIDKLNIFRNDYEFIPEVTPISPPQTVTTNVSLINSDRVGGYTVSLSATGSITVVKTYESNLYEFLEIRPYIRTSMSFTCADSSSTTFSRSFSSTTSNISFLLPIEGTLKYRFTINWSHSWPNYNVTGSWGIIDNTTSVDENFMAKPRIFPYFNNSNSMSPIIVPLKSPERISGSKQNANLPFTITHEAMTDTITYLIYSK